METLKETHSPEALALRARVIKGNQKLFQAWLEIRELADDREEWSRQMDKWDQAQKKLYYLNLELKARGYCDCLYRNDRWEKTKRCWDEPNDWWCQVCSSDYPYWQDERMPLFSPSSAP